LGGWGLGSATDLPYDHGREIEQYERDQKKIADWFKRNRYLENR
jgi:hypothetical protein